jgi:hypothetical protein
MYGVMILGPEILILLGVGLLVLWYLKKGRYLY